MFGRKKKKPDKFKPVYRKGRRGFNRNHPIGLVKKTPDGYEGVSMTHDDMDGNRRLRRNPNKKDKRRSYIHPTRYDVREKDLTEKIEGWRKLTWRDRRMIKRLAKSDTTPNEEYRARRDKKDN